MRRDRGVDLRRPCHRSPRYPPDAGQRRRAASGGEAESGPEAIRFIRAAAASAASAQPLPVGVNVVLMDIAMPERDGLDVLRLLRSEFPNLPVLMLSAYPDKQYAVRSMKLGAAGYLNKTADSQALCGAIRQVAAGGLFLTPHVAEQVASSISSAEPVSAAVWHKRLPPRQYQVFRLIAAGCSVPDIAKQLGMPAALVRADQACLQCATGARNEIELALYALRCKF